MCERVGLWEDMGGRPWPGPIQLGFRKYELQTQCCVSSEPKGRPADPRSQENVHGGDKNCVGLRGEQMMDG